MRSLPVRALRAPTRGPCAPGGAIPWWPLGGRRRGGAGIGRQNPKAAAPKIRDRRRPRRSVVADDLVARGGRRVDRAGSLEDAGAGRGVNPPHAVELVVVDVGAVRASNQVLPALRRAQVSAVSQPWPRQTAAKPAGVLDAGVAMYSPWTSALPPPSTMMRWTFTSARLVPCAPRTRNTSPAALARATAAAVSPDPPRKFGSAPASRRAARAGGEVVRRHAVERRIAVRVDRFDIGTFGHEERHLILVARRHAAIM